MGGREGGRGTRGNNWPHTEVTQRSRGSIKRKDGWMDGWLQQLLMTGGSRDPHGRAVDFEGVRVVADPLGGSDVGQPVITCEQHRNWSCSYFVISLSYLDCKTHCSNTPLQAFRPWIVIAQQH